MDSPIPNKKARQSLIGNISDFNISQDISTNEKSEMNNTFEKNENNEEESFKDSCSSPRSISEEFDIEEAFTTETKLRFENINRLYLTKKSLNAEKQMENINKRISINITNLRVLRRTPVLIQELPFLYLSSLCFKNFALHSKEDLVALNLNDRVNLLKTDKRIHLTPCITSDSTCCSVAFGSQKLQNCLMTSHFNSTLCVTDIDSQRQLKIYDLAKPTNFITSFIKGKDCLIYCGSSAGGIKVYDIRTNISTLQLNIAEEKPFMEGASSLNPFNPITNIDLANNIVFSSTPQEMMLWDIRKAGMLLSIKDPLCIGNNQGIPLEFENNQLRALIYQNCVKTRRNTLIYSLMVFTHWDV